MFAALLLHPGRAANSSEVLGLSIHAVEAPAAERSLPHGSQAVGKIDTAREFVGGL
jgi:hypothetical protein